MSRSERSADTSGTPHGLVSQASASDDLILLDTLGAEDEAKVLVEYPVGPEFTRQRGYARFVEFHPHLLVSGEVVGRAPRSYRYGLIKSGTKTVSPIRHVVTQAEVCPNCKYRGAIEHGLCAICRFVRVAEELQDSRIGFGERVDEPEAAKPVAPYCGTPDLITAQEIARQRGDDVV